MNGQEKIIIIEDDVDDQEILRVTFKELNVKNELQFFAACDDAYNFLMSTKEKPFLILCDINLPKMNGIELKKKIDTTDYLRKKAIPFIFFTTSDEQRTVDEAYGVSNLQGYFRKGHSMKEVRDKVKCIMDYWLAALHPSV